MQWRLSSRNSCPGETIATDRFSADLSHINDAGHMKLTQTITADPNNVFLTLVMARWLVSAEGDGHRAEVSWKEFLTSKHHGFSFW